MTDDEAPPRRRYAKPMVVPDSFDALTGPTSGVVILPRHLKWSGNDTYDLSQPGRIIDLYRTVINEAAAPGDLHSFLDAATLRSLWSVMWLPEAVRMAWESRFPELRRTAAAAA